MPFNCPAASLCSSQFKSSHGLSQHWQARHRMTLGPIEAYVDAAQPQRVDRSVSSRTTVSAGGASSTDPVQAPAAVVSAAMDHIDCMTFRHAEKPATVDRAKGMTSACLQALKPLLIDALRDSVCDGVNVGALIDPLLTAFDMINSRAGEAHERELRAEHPPLHAYERELGIRPAKLGKRKAVDGVRAYAWDISLEEALEREAHYDPHFVTELIMSDLYWTNRAKELRGTDRRDPSRTFEDMVDGEVWQVCVMIAPSRVTAALSSDSRVTLE